MNRKNDKSGHWVLALAAGLALHSIAAQAQTYTAQQLYEKFHTNFVLLPTECDELTDLRTLIAADKYLFAYTQVASESLQSNPTLNGQLQMAGSRVATLIDETGRECFQGESYVAYRYGQNDNSTGSMARHSRSLQKPMLADGTQMPHPSSVPNVSTVGVNSQEINRMRRENELLRAEIARRDESLNAAQSFVGGIWQTPPIQGSTQGLVISLFRNPLRGTLTSIDPQGGLHPVPLENIHWEGRQLVMLAVDGNERILFRLNQDGNHMLNGTMEFVLNNQPASQPIFFQRASHGVH